MAVTNDVVRNEQGRIVEVNGAPAPEHLASLRVPPAWVGLMVDTDPQARVLASGRDAAGRPQKVYAEWHKIEASDRKFKRVRRLLAEYDEVRSVIEADLNNEHMPAAAREAALVAYLVYETGMRPGSTRDTKAKVPAFGATTIQLRHVHKCAAGVRLRFTGKKGVKQDVLVTNPYLVELMLARKEANPAYTTRVFDCSPASLNTYIGTLSNNTKYTAKDLRTARGTTIAREWLHRKRVPGAKTKAKRLLNQCLDAVAEALGNTRAVCRTSYVDPEVVAKVTAVIEAPKQEGKAKRRKRRKPKASTK